MLDRVALAGEGVAAGGAPWTLASTRLFTFAIGTHVISLGRMTRYLRLYPKKRGERRTGSQQAGSAGLTLFFSGMVFLGVCFFAVMFTMLAWPELRVNQQFAETTCTILEKNHEEADRDGQTAYRPLFRVEYEADGSLYRGWTTWNITGTFYRDPEECKAILNRYALGERRCWYDRDDPQTVVLARGYSGYVWLTLFLPGALILVGSGGLAFRLVNWGMSAEHRKVWARTAAEVTPKDVTLCAGDYPTIPHDGRQTDSPGTRLAYRLPVESTGGWALLAMLFGCVVAGAMVSVLITLLIAKTWQGRFDWLLLLASLLFAGLTGWLIHRCLKRLTQLAHLGRTLVEISDHPLYPGARSRVCLAQFGRMRMRRMRLSLRCVEKATYQQGTNTRTESRVVAEQEVFDKRRFIIKPERPLEIEQEFGIPADAMHSFRSPRNEVAWMLVVEASPRRWPDFRRTFPVVVHPSPNGGSANGGAS